MIAETIVIVAFVLYVVLMVKLAREEPAVQVVSLQPVIEILEKINANLEKQRTQPPERTAKEKERSRDNDPVRRFLMPLGKGRRWRGWYRYAVYPTTILNKEAVSRRSLETPEFESKEEGEKWLSE